jgi:outer membrane lipoprotein SlyB
MAPPPPRVICSHCGTVTAVTPVEHDGAGSGAGAVAGALLGGLLGNQVGGGTGKTIATVIGAVGGGYAGNTVEKRMKKETVYHIDLQMEDGSTMRLEHPNPLSVGAHVTVNNGVITP